LAKPDGRPEKQPNQRFTLQTAFGKGLPVLKEVFPTLILRRRPLKIWGFVTNITNKFILGLGSAKRCVWQRKRYRYEAQGRNPDLAAW
jgi:hypothetical protein